MRQLVICAVVLLPTISALSSAASQAPTPADSSPPAARDSSGPFWFGVELGAGLGENDNSGPMLGLSVNVQRGRMLWSVRGDVVASLSSSNIGHVALVVGPASTRPGSGFYSFAVGPAFVVSQQCVSGCGLLSERPVVQHTTSTVGLVFAGDVALRGGGRGGIGIGLSAITNINSQSSFAGAGLTVTLGHWHD
jgi:hypothetical protein